MLGTRRKTLAMRWISTIMLVSMLMPWMRSGATAGGSLISAGSEFLDLNFESLSNGASITSVVTFWGTQGAGAYAGGTSGCYGDTSVKRTGKASSLRLSILSGSTGRPGDGANAAEGDFGFIKNFTSNVGEGGDVRLGAWMMFPTGFDFYTNSGYLKFIRLDNGDSNFGAQQGRLEIEILGGLLDGLSPDADQFGWAILNEYVSQAQSETLHRADLLATRNTWHWVEQYVHASATAANGIRRFWIDNTLIFECVGGSTLKYRNTSGTYSNASFATPVPTLASSNPYIPDFYLFTYWNGGARQNQSAYCSRVIVSNNNESASDLTTDSFGNKMIGSLYI